MPGKTAQLLCILQFPSNSFDSVVSTLVMCSVPSVPSAVEEVFRVLAHGGTFYFIEHVGAPHAHAALTVLQALVEFSTLWSFFADGCHVDRPSHHIISNHPGWAVQWEEKLFYGMLPPVWPHAFGTALKA